MYTFLKVYFMVYELYPGRTEQRKGREGGRKGEEENR